jgi:uncharacterized membrane protein
MKSRLLAAVFAWLVLGVIVFLLGDKIIPLGNPTKPEYVANYIKVAGIGMTLITAIATVVIPLLLVGGQEAEKQKAIARVEAYSRLYAAMRRYYRALSELERNSWRPASSEAAETGMRAAEGAMAFLADEPHATWETFWQAARTATENAAGLANPSQQNALWRTTARELAGLMKTFKVHANET